MRTRGKTGACADRRTGRDMSGSTTRSCGSIRRRGRFSRQCGARERAEPVAAVGRFDPYALASCVAPTFRPLYMSSLRNLIALLNRHRDEAHVVRGAQRRNRSAVQRRVRFRGVGRLRAGPSRRQSGDLGQQPNAPICASPTDDQGQPRVYCLPSPATASVPGSHLPVPAERGAGRTPRPPRFAR